jgi:hypothetical protein
VGVYGVDVVLATISAELVGNIAEVTHINNVEDNANFAELTAEFIEGAAQVVTPYWRNNMLVELRGAQ